MRIQQTGPIIDGLYMAGHAGTPLYLVDAERPAIFEGGMAFLANRYARDTAVFLKGRPPAWCLLTHSHFDHCGAVSFLKTYFPGMRVVASEQARNVFARPNALALMRQLSDVSAQMAADLGLPPNESPAFEPFEVDETAADDQSIPLSNDLTVRVISTPGHTRDSLSYYIPEKKILFASEAVGRAADNAIQIYGGMGLMEELPIERLWRDARLDRIWDGTSEIQRHIISRSLLRQYES